MNRISDPRRWEDIRIAFDAITDMNATKGSAHLAAIRTTDPELWASITALLNADAEADRWLEPIETAFAAGSATAGGDATERTRDPFGLSGRTFSHFQVFEPLGAGGMGVVYRAQDTRLGRAVALKFLLPQYSLDPAAKERFLQEGRSAAALDHPNLCTIHEVGETDDGRLFLAMPLYPGETLKARLTRDGPLPPTEAVEIARQVVHALGAAHAAGIVHRDLKPGNVMLLPGGMIKILDFGLAKVLDRSQSGSGAQFGTVSYMAPEQLRGESVDGRTDLWALGVVLYEGVTGRRPFGGESEISAARAILYDEPVAPSTLRGDVPTLVEEIILTLLAKDPSHRFASAAAVLDVLTTAARPHEPRRAPRIFARPRALYERRWFQLAGAGVVVATVVALGLVQGFGARRFGNKAGEVTIDAPTRIAVFPFSFHGREQFGYLSEGMVDLLSVALDGAGDLRRVDPHSLLRALRRESAGEPDAEGARTLARQFSADLFVLGNVVEADAQLVISATLYDVVGRVEPIAVAQRRGPAAALPFMVDGLAADLLQDRLKSEAQVGLRQAGTATRTTASLVALKHYLTGEPLLRAGRYDEAAREYAAAVGADSTFALAYLRLSVALLNSINAGGPSQEEVIARAVKHGDRLPQRDRALLMAADAYGRRREQAEAITILRRHVQYYPDDAEAWWRLGEMEFHYGLRSGQPIDQVRAALQRAVDLDSTNMGPLIELRMLAEVEGNRAENLAISRRMLVLAPRSIFRVITQTDVALLTDDPVAARKGIRAARQLDPFLRWLFLGRSPSTRETRR